MRLVRVVALLVVAIGIATGCGGGGSDGGGGGDTPDGRAAFDASRIPYGVPGVIVRLDDERLARSFDVARRVAGVRAAEESLPSRDALLRLVLGEAGIDVPEAATFDDWIGDEAGAALTEDGWVAWARIRDGRTDQAERFTARANGLATRVEGDELVLAARRDALDAIEDVDDTLADHRRWKALDEARSAPGALLAATDGDLIGVAGSDDDGLWFDGSGSTEDSCAVLPGDQLDQLETLPIGTTLGAAPATATQLGNVLARGMSVTGALRARLPDEGIVSRVVAAGERAVTAARLALQDHAATQRPAAGLQDVGTANPAVVAAGADRSATLAEDPGFVAARRLVDTDERVVAAAWLDPVRILRALGESQLDGIEGSVVGALGDGIDGVVAWRTCADRLGVRVAIPD